MGSYTPGFKFGDLEVKCILRYKGTLFKVMRKAYEEHGDGRTHVEMKDFAELSPNKKYYFTITVIDGGATGNAYYISVDKEAKK